MSKERNLPCDNVNYPPKCEGNCRLGELALLAVHDILARNCAGPWTPSQPLETEDAVNVNFVADVDGHSGVIAVGDDGRQVVCQNPRFAHIARNFGEFIHRLEEKQ